jgi:hypothetical protein
MRRSSGKAATGIGMIVMDAVSEVGNSKPPHDDTQ